MDLSRNSGAAAAAGASALGAQILQQDPVQLRDTLHQMHLVRVVRVFFLVELTLGDAASQDMEGLEKRVARVQKAAKALQRAYKVMNEASLQFQESLVPFAEGKDDHIIKDYTQALGKVYESEMGLGDRVSSVLVDALQGVALPPPSRLHDVSRALPLPLLCARSIH